MSPRALSAASQIGMACLPGVLAAAAGCLLSPLAPAWLAVALGGALATALALVGALVNAVSARLALPQALLGAMLSFALRMGGVIVAAVVLGSEATIALATLGGCLAATLVIEMLSGWMRVVRPEHTGLPQESARA